MGTGWVFTPPDPKTLLQAMDNALTTYFDFAESWQVGPPLIAQVQTLLELLAWLAAAFVGKGEAASHPQLHAG